MALGGDTLARQRLKETVYKYAAQDSEDENVITDAFVDLQTTGEFLELARIYGKRLVEDRTAFPFEWLLPEGNKQVYKDLLYQSAQKDPLIQRYWQYLNKRGILNDSPKTIDPDAAKKNWHERVRHEYSLEKILQDAQNKKGDFPGHYVTFGKHATKEELAAVYAALMSEKDPEVQLRLLWVFRRATFPKIDHALFQWASGPDSEFRETAIEILSQVQDQKVHQLAKEKVKRAELTGPDSGIIGLFHKNYEKPDAQIIVSALNSIEANEEDVHSLVFDLLALSRIQSDPGLSNALKWVYENTPCMNCRYQALLQLNKYNQIDEQVLQEIPFDAEPDIRELANKLRKVEC